MADLSDVLTFIKGLTISAVYPNGVGVKNAVTGTDVRIAEGWPLPDELELDMQGNLPGTPPVPNPNGPTPNVTIYHSGVGQNVYQIQDNVQVVAQPVFGITVVSVVNNVITVSGQPNPGEYLTTVVDGQFAFSRGDTSDSPGPTANTAAILAAIAADAVAAGYAASSTATTLTIPAGHSMAVLQGGIGTLGKVTHRQSHDIMVCVWAPNHTLRAVLCSTIDAFIKEKLTYILPDTSMMTLVYSRTNMTDEEQVKGIYRRDLVYRAEFATLQTFPGAVVTSVNLPLTVVGPGGNAAPVIVIS